MTPRGHRSRSMASQLGGVFVALLLCSVFVGVLFVCGLIGGAFE